ncbi:MAG: hypothetical protein JST47_13205 [Bacteroidetes bacterium]|nr:hypothetical protein [Bacteroidota bacterium]MBS1975631.1 hypothetical protein [Bacteroidota bacterium]
MHIDSSSRAGMIGGTLIVLLFNVFVHDVFRTVLLAVIGATVSFFVSYGWKHAIKYWQIKKRKKL